jgi:Ca2+-binding RTX toxin-like protein
MFLEYQQRLSTGDIVLDTDIRGLEVVHLNSGSFLMASTGVNGGLVSYALNTNGSLRSIADTVYFPDVTSTALSGALETVNNGSNGSVLLAGGAGTAMMLYGLSANGTLSNATATAASSGSSTITAAQVGNTTFYYSVSQDSGQVTRHAPNGTTTPLQVYFNEITAVDTVQIGHQSFLLTTQDGTSGIISHAINANGALTHADNLGAEQGLGVSVPTSFDTVNAFGQTWVIMGSAGTSTLSVLEMTANGQLNAVDHVMDTLETRFGGVQAVAIAQVGDRVFVVAGGADDGLSLFTLMPDGRLIHLETIPHTIGAGLMNVGEIETSMMGDALQIFVNSDTDTGITRFSVDLSDLGSTLRGDTTGAGRLQGSAGDDLLVAGLGDTLIGGAGDDILVGALNARLDGGAGADIFVMDETGGTTRIQNFTSGEDQLDLSSYFMLRSVNQLNITSTSSGARVQFNDTTIQITSSNGLSLDRDDLFGRAFDWADRIPILERTDAPPLEPEPTPPTPTPTPTPEPTPTPTPEPTPTPTPVIRGLALSGGNGSDNLRGSAMSDTLSGGAGRDTLTGYEGNDLLTGDSGNDLLIGGGGADWMSGASGSDTLRGQAGNDTLEGGASADELDGGDDHDVLRGGEGTDTLEGGAGHDTLTGGDGDDHLYGGSGNDVILGTNGNDTLHGDEGNDTLSGAAGDDVFDGGAGNDTIWGGFGNDRLLGGWGNDMMGGSEGNDLMYGGEGNDTVWGGSQHDTLRGGDGVDTVGGFWGNDIAYGEEGDDFVWGNFGNDTLYGGNGNDMIGGAEGEDVLVGGNGHDTLVGGDNSDELMGGKGNDELRGGAGDDWLSGGWGADTFYFFYNHTGSDRIADFKPEVDQIQFDTNSVRFSTLRMFQQGDDVMIRLNRGQITLADTDLSDLGAEHFLFG